MPKLREQDKNEPWVENYPALAEWLEENGAVCNWQMPRGRSPRAILIESWQLNGHVFIIEVRSNQHGWSIYTALPSNNVALTLADALIRCSK